MIKYLGSKRTLLPEITAIAQSLPNVHSVIDFFSGTSRVGHAFKRLGIRVMANDHLAYAFATAMCYVQADREQVHCAAGQLIDEFNALPGKPGYFTESFCIQSQFFQPRNGERVDAIRDAIAAKSLDPELEAVVLVALMEAADRVDSTTGVQMAYLKTWAPRAYNDLQLRMPDVLPAIDGGHCSAHCLDAHEAADALEADLAYIDPPYNQHSYLGNYHIWESLVRWDKPDLYGIARKRIDCRTRKSAFNSRAKAADAFDAFLAQVQCPYLIVSFNDEGFIERDRMEALLGQHGRVHTISKDYKRYVGAQIGIHNPAGEKVGTVSHLRNKEFLYIVTPIHIDWQPPAALQTIEAVNQS